VGRPAVHDRNGSEDLLAALFHVTADIRLTVTCQEPGYVESMLHRFHVPANVELVVRSGDVDNNLVLYEGQDVLLMPRRFGGLSLPANEALGSGMPVVMPDISPNNTWLPSDWLVPATLQGSFMAKQRVDYYSVDHRALAAKIDLFASDAGFFQKAKREAAELRDQLSWDALLLTYHHVLRHSTPEPKP
jgi:glycosyltransferase involved in cell wall biosynthesis